MQDINFNKMTVSELGYFIKEATYHLDKLREDRISAWEELVSVLKTYISEYGEIDICGENGNYITITDTFQFGTLNLIDAY